MKKFKVGDTVKYIAPSDDYHVTKGKIYKILGFHNDGYPGIKSDRPQYDVPYYVYEHNLQLVKKKKLKKETDFLDAFQENFKEGV